DGPDEHLSLLLVPLPGRQVRQHVRDREVQRLDLLALHPARAVGQDDEVQRAPGDAATWHPRMRCGLGHHVAFRGSPWVVWRGPARPPGFGAGHDDTGLGEAIGMELLPHHLSRAANDEFGAPRATMNASCVGIAQAYMGWALPLSPWIISHTATWPV